MGGTTSACAENTPWTLQAPTLFGNYLRVRGEYGFLNLLVNTCKELPPRARRIPQP